jgi:hypothetical protein
MPMSGRAGKAPGHGRVRIASGLVDNHFAEGASLADVSKRCGNLFEREGAVDVDPYFPGDAEGGQRLEIWAGPSLTARIPIARLVSRPTSQPAVSTRSSVGTDPPTHR